MTIEELAIIYQGISMIGVSALITVCGLLLLLDWKWGNEK